MQTHGEVDVGHVLVTAAIDGFGLTVASERVRETRADGRGDRIFFVGLADVDDRNESAQDFAAADEHIEEIVGHGIPFDASGPSAHHQCIGNGNLRKRCCRDVATEFAGAVRGGLSHRRETLKCRIEVFRCKVTGRIARGCERGACIADGCRDFCFAHLQRRGRTSENEVERERAGACVEHLGGNAAGEFVLRQTGRVERNEVDGVPPIEVRGAIVHCAHGNDGGTIDGTEIEHGIVGAAEVIETKRLKHDRNGTIIDALGERVADRSLARRRHGAAESVGHAIGIRAKLHREPIDAMDLLELACRAAAVHVGRIAVVALLAHFADAIAADDRHDGLARRVARGRIGRFALLAAGHVDAAVAACRCGAHALLAKAAGTCRAVGGIHAGRAPFAHLAAHGDVGARFGAVAHVRVDAIRVHGTRELAIRFAARVGAVCSAEIAIFARFEGAVAAHGIRSLAGAILAGVWRNARGIHVDVGRRADVRRIASCDLARRCGGTIGGRIDAGKRAIGIAAIGVDQIAVIADFAGLENAVTANRRGANATLADLAQSTGHAIANWFSAGMRCIVARRGNARIQARAIARGIRRQTGEFTVVATITIGDIAVVAFFRHAHEEIAAYVAAADARNAELPIAAISAIGRGRSLGASMILLAGFAAITRIHVVTLGVARGGARIVAGEAAIGFATIA